MKSNPFVGANFSTATAIAADRAIPRVRTEGWNPASLHESMELLKEARGYQRWLLETIRPHLGCRILEIGSGIGTYTDSLASAERLIATDVDGNYVETLAQRYRGRNHISAIRLDLGNLTPTDIEQFLSERLDTVVGLNVLEHVRNDEICVRRLLEILAPGGKLVLIVPASPLLMSRLDRCYGHYRRYGRRDAARLAHAACGHLLECRPFNALGYFGWLINHRIFGRTQIPADQLRLFDRLTPWLQAIERLFPPPFGQSLLIVINKSPNPSILKTREFRRRPRRNALAIQNDPALQASPRLRS